MSFLPLTLGVGPLPETEGGSLKFPSKSTIEKILNRDGFACRFCGFRASQYQRVIPFEGEFVTACGFCEQVMALDRAGIMGSSILIWLPEITQVELNHIARAIYVARSENGAASDAASRALEALMSRRSEAKKRLGSDDPLLLATVLQENLTASERAIAASKLDGVRLLPLDKYIVHGRNGDINGFPQIVKFWCSPQGPFAQLPVDKWQDMFAKVAA